MLYRIEKHYRNDKLLFDLCHKAKNLYNKANFYVRQTFIESRNLKELNNIDKPIYLGKNELYKIMQNDVEYKELPTQAGQGVLKYLDENWKSFFKIVKDKKKHPEKYNGNPKIPSFLNKKGLYILTFPGQNIFIQNNLGGFYIPKTRYFVKTNVKKGTVREVRLVPINNYKIKIEIVYEKQINDLKLNSNNVIGIDLGVNNLLSITSNQEQNPQECKPLLYLVNGRPIKSINQFYNKKQAKYFSELKIINNKDISKKINRLNYKRTQKIEDYFHKTSRWLINLCIENNIGRIVIGKNKDWKQESDLGKRNNQNFVTIPFNRLIQMIVYKAEEVGIVVNLTEESYTSKIDHLAGETMEHHENYQGKRIKRGLFRSSTGITLNADINGSMGMLRKINVAGKDYFNSLVSRGSVLEPVKLNF